MGGRGVPQGALTLWWPCGGGVRCEAHRQPVQPAAHVNSRLDTCQTVQEGCTTVCQGVHVTGHTAHTADSSSSVPTIGHDGAGVGDVPVVAAAVNDALHQRLWCLALRADSNTEFPRVDRCVGAFLNFG
jgi:hypothetical protein